MEAALVSGLIKMIVPRLFSLSSEKNKLHKSVKGNIEFLQHELEMIARSIDDQISRGEHLSSARTQWIEELRKLAYEIEDCIDRYVYGLTYKQQASSMRRATMMLAGIQMQFASEIRALREKVKEPFERIQRYTSESQCSTKANETTSGPSYDPHTEKADLVGIEVSQKEILELLEEGKDQLKQRKVISIVGFDGLGKTVLAEQVFDSDVVAEKFRPMAKIVATDKDAKDVLWSICSELGIGKELQGSGNIKLLSSVLEAHLQKKRYLIVIDDMRTELWSTIGSAFPANKGLSCRVIVTTPIQSIAYACSSDDRYVYKMRQLCEKHSAQLFQRKAPKVELDQTQILKKCDGLPLALVSIAQFMSKKRVPNGTTTCKDLCNRLGYYLETDKDTLARMQGVLTKNYTSLDGPELKACLLYLSMFPSEHPIKMKRLIRQWLAEGFVETHDMAKINFEQLMDRNIVRVVVGHNKKVKTCTACGMMMEFILRKSISQDFITVFSNGTAKLLCDQGVQPTCARRLCLHRMSKSNGGSLGDVSLVRSLAIFGEADQNLMELKKCQLLRVLDLEECSDLKDINLKGISNFLLLKYLSLGETITLLPKEITNLEFLQTLNVRRKNVTTLPVEVMLLPFLVGLHGKFRLAGKAKQINRAQKFLDSGKSKLQTLAGFIADDESEGFAQLMIRMKNLRKAKVWCASSIGTVYLSKAVEKFIEDDKDEEQANQDDRSLSLHLFDQSSSDFLHSLEGSCYLSSLKLHGYMGTVLPQFVSLLRGLRDLCLSTSNLTPSILATMSKLCYLQYLKLTADQLEESVVIEAGAFPKLLRLCIVLQRPTNNVLEIKEGALPKLVALQLHFKGLYGPSGINIVHLNSLKEVSLDPDQTTKLDEWQTAAKEHPNRPSIEVLGSVYPVEIEVAGNSAKQDEKPTPEMAVTQKPLYQNHYSPSTRLKIPQEINDALNCRSEEFKKMCLDHECSLNSTNASNVASGANLTRTTS